MTALVAMLLLVPAADAKEKELSEAAQKEVKKLDGKWKAVKAVTNGEEETPKMDDQEVVIEFKGRKLLMGDKHIMDVNAMDPSTDTKCIDLKAVVQMGGISKDTVYEAIYKLDGDTLLLAIHVEGGGNRPGKFESAKDSKVVVITFERVKK